jgi:hypothetical protein
VSPLVLAVVAAGWVDAGAFRLRLGEREEKLTLEVDAKAPVRLRLADGVMLRLREDQLKRARLTIHRIEDMLQDKEHGTPQCRKSLLGQLTAARKQAAAIEAQDVSTRVIAEPGVPVVVDLWMASPVLSELSVDGKTLYLSEHIELQVPPRWLALDDETDLSIRNGVVLQRPDVGGAGCFGAEGLLSVPGPWGPAPKVFTHGRMLLRHGTVVIDGRHAARLLLSSPAADTFQWVDEQRIGENTVVVFTAEGPSRPKSPMSMCGAGTERDGVWLLLDANGAVTKQQIVQLESCFTSKQVQLRYDPKHPLDGVGVR